MKCSSCGAPIETKKCNYCGSINSNFVESNSFETMDRSHDINGNSSNTPNININFGGIPNNYQYDAQRSPKDFTVTLVLAILFGAFGVHHFYSGRYAKGFLYLFTLGLFYFGWIIDVILIIMKKYKDSKGRVIRN